MGGLFKTKTVSTTAEKLSDFQINSASYGESVPVIFGTTRISGNIIDWYDFTAIPHTTTQRTGKGGGSKTKSTDYTYTVACLIGMGEGPIQGIGTVWKDKETYTSLAGIDMTLFSGEYGQSPWSYTQGKYPDKALPYSGLAYVAGVVDLGTSNGLPTLNFEVKGMLLDTGDGVDANPADAIKYIVTDSFNGIDLGDIIETDSLDRVRTYAKATDLLISTPPDSTNQKAYETINDFCEALDTATFWSVDKLKFAPLCMDEITGNGVTFMPNKTVIHDLTADDFLPMDDGKLVKLERVPDSQAYNQYTIEFINRLNAYESETVNEQVLADVNKRGLRPADSISMHFLHTKKRASYVANTKGLNTLTRRNKYTFRLDSTFFYLEPGDLLTITDTPLGLRKQPVVVDGWEEVDEEEIEFTVYGIPRGNYSAGIYNVHEAERPSIDFNADPGPVNAPVFFELPYILTDGKMAVMAAVAGSRPLWGGCNVWVSTDREKYQYAGQVKGPARYGVLTEILKTGGAVDALNTLKVDITKSNGQTLLGGTLEDATTMKTLCWVDGELIAYQTSTLTETNRYNLSYLVRGCYGTEIKGHAKNSDFVRLDKDILFGYEYLPVDIGRTIYVKFTSINAFGIREQALEDVEPYTYVIQGKLPDSGVEFTVTQNDTKLVASLKNTYSNDDYLDFFTYELRLGPSWENGALIGRFTGETYTFDAPGEGTLTFWLKVVDQAGNYSKTASRAIVNVINLPVRNIIFGHEEDPDLWTVNNMWRDSAGRYRIRGLLTLGDYEYFSNIFGHDLYLKDGAEIIFPAIDLGPNILDESCYYVDAAGNIKLRYVERLGDFARFSDIFGATLTQMKPEYAKETFVGVTIKYTTSGNARIDIEYRTSIDGQQWGAWTPAATKQFTGRYVQIRLLPLSIDGIGQVYISGATVQIDVPDVEEVIENVTIPAERARIYFKRKFAEVKSVAPYTQDNSGKQATCYIAEQTNEYIDLEIWDEAGSIIPGKLQIVKIRGY